MRGAGRQPRAALVHQIEIDEVGKGVLERLRGVVSWPVSAKRIVVAGMGERIGPEEPGNSVCYRRPVGQFFVEAGEYLAKAPDRLLLHPLPEFLQARHAVLRRIAGDEARIDGTDRCADNPVRLNSSLVQRLIDACLIRSKRAAALQYQHDLTGECSA